MAKPSALRLVWVPALITLGVTLLRLAGELLHWSESLFSRAPGGGAALVGIVWLIFVFGAWFGWRLAREGEQPVVLGPAFGWPLLGFVLNTGVFVGALFLWPADPVVQLGVFTLGSWTAMLMIPPREDGR